MIDIKTILYPTDFSDYAKHAQRYAIELARKFDSKVVILHVASIPAYPVAYEIAVDIKALDEEIQTAAGKRLDQIRDEFAAEDIQVETQLAIGQAFAEIVVAARNSDADLVVLATHGLGPVKHMLMGSTAEKVVRKAPCPVLTVRHPEHEFVHP